MRKYDALRTLVREVTDRGSPYRAQLHNLRNGEERLAPTSLAKYVGEQPLRADTKSDDEWVLLVDAAAGPVVRQSKFSNGRVFAQGTNPDYDGRESYAVEFRYPNDDSWHGWDDQAKRGYIATGGLANPPKADAWMRRFSRKPTA